MAHHNARLTPRTRGELVQYVLAGWPQAEVARLFRVSRATVAKWVRRYREAGGGGLQDRTSRPLTQPRQTPPDTVAAICHLRQERNWGPHRIAWALGLARSTVYAVLRRVGLHRLAWLHRTTRQIVRYEHQQPGELLHLDVKKLGRIPPGGGKRILPDFWEAQTGPKRQLRLGFDFLHVAVDDYSRYAYVEALPDERGTTTAAFLERALIHFAGLGVTVQRVLTDNGSGYISRVFAQVATGWGVRLKRTRPYRPQTNGKAEAFNKILQTEWAYIQPFSSNAERLALLPAFLTYYNQERSHGGIRGATPASRLSTRSLGTTARRRSGYGAVGAPRGEWRRG